MKTFVEFYFPGVSCSGCCEKEVSSRDADVITSIPNNAISFRFFNKNDAGEKVNYSQYFYIGTEYSIQDFKLKYPQLAGDFDASSVHCILKSVTGAFYALSEKDVVVPA